MKLSHTQRRMTLGLLKQRGGRAWVQNRQTAEALERRGLVTLGGVDDRGWVDVALTDAGRAEA